MVDENKFECDQESKKVDGGTHGCCGRCIRDWSCNGRDEAAAAHCIPIKLFKIMMRMMAGMETHGYVPAQQSNYGAVECSCKYALAFLLLQRP